ncbi:hypothetical protein [Kutzneria chonburiensis]|uniref:ParB/Sulfiredoxin domain-containing protein n=1 Tax=Kutzneria chonburiensis TaxID=1483604 RepID=A0ABV6MHT9_9PSEU|nr:hypothetical protein [Kutzneria chonburiensis]
MNDDEENENAMPNVSTVYDLSKKEFWQHQRNLIAQIARNQLGRGKNGRDALYRIDGQHRLAKPCAALDAEQVSILINIGYVAEETGTITRYLDFKHKEPVTVHRLTVTSQGYDFMRDVYAPRSSS